MSHEDYNVSYSNQQPQIIIQHIEEKSNGMGKAGLTLSIITLILCWVPVLSRIMWFLGFLFSFIGLFKSPRGAAVAGFIISLIDVIAIIVLLFVILGAGILDSYVNF